MGLIMHDLSFPILSVVSYGRIQGKNAAACLDAKFDWFHFERSEIINFDCPALRVHMGGHFVIVNSAV